MCMSLQSCVLLTTVYSVCVTLESIFSRAMFAAQLARVAVSGPQVPGLHMVGHGGGVRAVERTLVASPAAVNLPHHQLSDGLRQI